MKKNQKNTLRIGIPNTLFSAYHLSFWRQFITLAGMETVLAEESTKETADRGGRLLPHEFCIPIKVFVGHVQNLLEREVDQILIPRMTSEGKVNYFCPKLIGLPEIVHHTTGLANARMFSPHVVCDGLAINIREFPELKSISHRQFRVAAQKANEYWKTVLMNCRRQKIMLPEATNDLELAKENNGLSIGLLGYAYSLYDPFISKKIVTKLGKLGVDLITWEMLDPELIESNLARLKRPLFWNFGRMVLGAGLHFLADPQIDGVIYVTTFGCGPDSVSMKLLSLEAGKCQKPLLMINLDDHTETGHLNTRLEAFVDMLATLKEEMMA